MAQDEEFAGANYAPIEETGEVHQEWLRQGERSAAEEAESRRTAEAKTKAQAEELKRQQESRRIEEERLAAEERRTAEAKTKAQAEELKRQEQTTAAATNALSGSKRKWQAVQPKVSMPLCYELCISFITRAVVNLYYLYFLCVQQLKEIVQIAARKCDNNENLLPCGITVGSLLLLLLISLEFEHKYFWSSEKIVINRVLVCYWRILEDQGPEDKSLQWTWENSRHLRVPPGENRSEYNNEPDGVNKFINLIVDQINQVDKLDHVLQSNKNLISMLREKNERVLSSIKKETQPIGSRTRQRRASRAK